MYGWLLSGGERGERYAVFSAADRQAILEILRETTPELPDDYVTGR